jgi:hypothetical protein
MPDAPVEQSSLFRKSWTMGAPLSKARLSGVFPAGFLDTWGPAEVREDEENLHQFKTEAKQGGRPFEPVGWINGESIRYATLPRASWALLWMQHGGRWAFTLIFPAFCLVTVFGYSQLSDELSFSEYYADGIQPFLVYMFLPMLLFWGIGRYLEKKYPEFVYRQPKGPLWELNRQTGMVTIYKDPENEGHSGEIRGQAPFHEWDGYLLSLPDHQGNLWYRLVLVHKTRELALPLNQLVAVTTNREDMLAYWDVIRQYMDVTKPLPDMPLFEPYRHLDPTTSEYDQKKGRESRYWRDMSKQEYERFKEDNRHKLYNNKW